MDSLHTISLESDSRIKINFDGGSLSPDAGLLLFKKFLFKIGAVKLISRIFKTNDTARFRIHEDDANLMHPPACMKCLNPKAADTPSG